MATVDYPSSRNGARVNTGVLEDVCGIASDVLGAGTQELSAQSSPDTIANWDSVQQLYLVLALEERFNVQFEPSDIDRMRTLGDIANVLESKLSV